MKQIIFLLVAALFPLGELAALPALHQSGVILNRIGKQESAKDATCWTTARMMEQFYSQLPLSEEAALLKIEILKGLASQLWNEAAARRSSCRISKEDMQGVLAPYISLVEETFSSPEGLQARLEYARITENWRILLSLFFQPDITNKKVLAPEALEIFGTTLTDITLLFLRLSSEEAKAVGHREVEPIDMKMALGKLPQRSSSLPSTKTPPSCPSLMLSNDELLELTQKNMSQKISSLQAWNKRAWKSELERKRREHDIALEFLAKVSPVALTPQAQSYVLDVVTRAVRYISKGYYPDRSNLMYEPSTLFNYHPVRKRDAKGMPSILQSDHVFNVTQELYPRITDIRGDVHLRLREKEGKSRKEEKILLEGTYLDAIRDTTLHWWILDKVWREEGALPLEPLAAELLAERTSEMIGAYLQIAEHGATKNAKTLNTFDVQLRVHRFRLLSPKRQQSETFAWKDGMSTREELQYFRNKTSQTVFSQLDCNPLSRNAAAVLQTGEFPDLSIQLHSGSGLAVGDINRDGFPDLFIGGTECNRLLLNKGNFVFEDVSEQLPNRSDLKSPRHALFSDLNGDALLDLLVVQSQHESKVWYQLKEGGFQDVTKRSRIRTNIGAHFASALDYDRDGDLDLFLGHYGKGNKPTIDGKNGVASQLYRNTGDGVFEDVTAQSGLHTTAWSLAGVSADMNGDGWGDIFLANDFGFDELFINNRDGTFTDIAHAYGVADRGNGMSATLGDLNHDRFPELFVSVIDMFNKNIGFVLPVPSTVVDLNDRIMKSSFSLAGNKYYQNAGGKHFLPVMEQLFPPIDYGWDWGALLFDVDNDGDQDFYVTNGWLDGTNVESQQNHLLIFEDGKFRHSYDKASQFYGMSRAVTSADLDNDGRLDLLVSNLFGPPTVLENNLRTKNNWISFDVFDDKRLPLGATVQIEVDGNKKGMQVLTAGSNYLTQVPDRLHFGLGGDTEVTALEILWPDGKQERRSGRWKAGKSYRIER